MYLKPRVIAIVGPTASGKTALSIQLAKHFDGEIVSADSRQVYRGMDIGTGKVTRREMRGIPHHLLDVASPRRTFTAAHYQRLGKKAVEKILAKGKLPIVVGGTGLYLDTLLYNYTLPSVRPNSALRKKLEKRSTASLFSRLKRLDPRRAQAIDRHNKRRLVRAIEIVLVTKRPVPSREEAFRHENTYDVLKIGIAPAASKLKNNISLRLSKRLRGAALIKEIATLHKNGLSWERLDSFGLEYRFVSRYIRGMISKAEMIAAVNQESWLYAKRQMTWFKRDKSIHWIKNPRTASALVKKFIKK